jgi:FliI/YscN family ATPase
VKSSDSKSQGPRKLKALAEPVLPTSSQPGPQINLDSFYEKLETQHSLPVTLTGRVRNITSMIIQARLPNGRIGDICTIEPPGRPPVKAQIVGFNDEDVYLSALDPLNEVGPKTKVINRGKSLLVAVGEQLLGRVVDSLGEPIDGKGPINCSTTYPIKRNAPEPMKRKRITEPLPLGIRSIDLLLTIGEGQRIGIFSTAGVGKSSLLGMIARNSTADVNVVALVGERGREVLDFVEDNLGEEGLKKSVVVVSTSDQTPLRRVMAAYTATAIAEYFRDQGLKVNLLMDSVTRFARALREIALSVGEPPARQGYPPSVFAALPELLERAGNTQQGSITAFYTILLSSDLIEDPLGEEIKAILDGHLNLNAKLSHAGHYPAIDPLTSNSRLMENIVSAEHRSMAERIRRLWSTFEESKDLIMLGAYKRGNDALVDEAVAKRKDITKLLVQSELEQSNLQDTINLAKQVLDS